MFLSTVLAPKTQQGNGRGSEKSASFGMADNATRARELAAILRCAQALVK